MLRWERLLGVAGTLKPLLPPYCTLCTLSWRPPKAEVEESVLAE
jgi:hypothetical protein